MIYPFHFVYFVILFKFIPIINSNILLSTQKTRMSDRKWRDQSMLHCILETPNHWNQINKQSYQTRQVKTENQSTFKQTDSS